MHSAFSAQRIVSTRVHSALSALGIGTFTTQSSEMFLINIYTLVCDDDGLSCTPVVVGLASRPRQQGFVGCLLQTQGESTNGLKDRRLERPPSVVRARGAVARASLSPACQLRLGLGRQVVVPRRPGGLTECHGHRHLRPSTLKGLRSSVSRRGRLGQLLSERRVGFRDRLPAKRGPGTSERPLSQ